MDSCVMLCCLYHNTLFVGMLVSFQFAEHSR